jgi:uncharacterized membrane protein
MESFTIDIAATPERVWEVMSDFESWPKWTPSVRSITRLGSGPVRVGSRVLIRQPKFPPAVWKMMELGPGHHFTWRSGFPGMWVLATHTIVATATGSRVALALHYHGPLGKLLARMTRSVTRRYLEFEATGLKRQSEISPKPVG